MTDPDEPATVFAACDACMAGRRAAWNARGRPELDLLPGEIAFGNCHEQKHSELLDTCLDAKICDFVEWLNRVGVTTMFSCEEMSNVVGRHFQVVITFDSLPRWMELFEKYFPLFWTCKIGKRLDRVAMAVPWWLLAWFDDGLPALSADELEARWWSA